MRQPNGIEFATTRLATDVTLHLAKRDDREGEAILFLHAYTDSWFSFSRVLPVLLAEYHTFAPDERGHGASDKPEYYYMADDFTADVDAFMDALELEEATLAGDSLAGMIAQRLALDYSHCIKRLVLIGPQPRW